MTQQYGKGFKGYLQQGHLLKYATRSVGELCTTLKLIAPSRKGLPSVRRYYTLGRVQV